MKRKGFTLIELLIVVAIIAILAAIAVPNFLEAQVRAKVSRAKTDMRSLATGIEAYAVDYNKAPLGSWESQMGPGGGQPGATPPCQGNGWLNDEWLKYKVQSRLTTPVAYLTSYLSDPFRSGTKSSVNPDGTAGSGNQKFDFYDYDTYSCPGNTKIAQKQAFSRGYTWSTWSVGPKRVNSGRVVDILMGTAPVLTDLTPTAVYDPTNGTTSAGLIIRTNKGVFSSPGS